MIKQITHLQALEFFLEHKGWQEKVTFTEKGNWYGLFVKDHMQGLVSTQKIGKWLRIKTLFVPKKHRGNNFGFELVKHVSVDNNCSAFAFDVSKPIFEKAGFKVEKQGKNGVWFMRKEIV